MAHGGTLSSSRFIPKAHPIYKKSPKLAQNFLLPLCLKTLKVLNLHPDFILKIHIQT